MKTLLSWTLAALVAAGSLHHAQAPKGAHKAAAEPVAVPARALRVPLAGLTRDNARAIETALSALRVSVHACDACAIEQVASGTCTGCGGALQAAQRPILASVAASPEEQGLVLAIAPRRVLALSELASALVPFGARLDGERLLLSGPIVLVVDGAGAAQLDALQKALRESQAFEDVQGSYDEAARKLRFAVRAPAARPPSHAALAALVASLGATLADVRLPAEPAPGS